MIFAQGQGAFLEFVRVAQGRPDPFHALLDDVEYVALFIEGEFADRPDLQGGAVVPGE